MWTASLEVVIVISDKLQVRAGVELAIGGSRSGG